MKKLFLKVAHRLQLGRQCAESRPLNAMYKKHIQRRWMTLLSPLLGVACLRSFTKIDANSNTLVAVHSHTLLSIESENSIKRLIHRNFSFSFQSNVLINCAFVTLPSMNDVRVHSLTMRHNQYWGATESTRVAFGCIQFCTIFPYLFSSMWHRVIHSLRTGCQHLELSIALQIHLSVIRFLPIDV